MSASMSCESVVSSWLEKGDPAVGRVCSNLSNQANSAAMFLALAQQNVGADVFSQYNKPPSAVDSVGN